MEVRDQLQDPTVLPPLPAGYAAKGVEGPVWRIETLIIHTLNCLITVSTELFQFHSHEHVQKRMRDYIAYF